MKRLGVLRPHGGFKVPKLIFNVLLYSALVGRIK